MTGSQVLSDAPRHPAMHPSIINNRALAQVLQSSCKLFSCKRRLESLCRS